MPDHLSVEEREERYARVSAAPAATVPPEKVERLVQAARALIIESAYCPGDCGR